MTDAAADTLRTHQAIRHARGLLVALNVSAADAALRELLGDPPAPDHTAEVQALRCAANWRR